MNGLVVYALVSKITPSLSAKLDAIVFQKVWKSDGEEMILL